MSKANIRTKGRDRESTSANTGLKEYGSLSWCAIWRNLQGATALRRTCRSCLTKRFYEPVGKSGRAGPYAADLDICCGNSQRCSTVD